MTYDDLIAHFKSEAAAGHAIGASRQAVHRWKKSGQPVPIDQQMEFERVTDGALRADLSEAMRTVLARNRFPATPEPASA